MVSSHIRFHLTVFYLDPNGPLHDPLCSLNDIQGFLRILSGLNKKGKNMQFSRRGQSIEERGSIDILGRLRSSCPENVNSTYGFHRRKFSKTPLMIPKLPNKFATD